MNILLPSPVAHAIERLNTAGYEAFAVGGCVRDSMLGKEPNDWDITTSAEPQQTARVFSDCKTIETGVQHGTLTVLLEGMSLEITTYRIDGTYSDSRRPDSVIFTSNLREDLRRRDFTINAMAYHPQAGIVDCFSGMADLEDGRICCVGNPVERFTEDALRIIRALRFSSTLGFSIEKVTADAIHRLAPLLRRVAPERLATELKKLLCGVDARRVLLEYPDVISVVIPELKDTVGLQQDNPYHYLTVYEHTAETVGAIPADPILRLTMLFHDCGKPACYTRDEHGVDHFRGHPAVSSAMAEQAMERLRMDRHTIDVVTLLIMHHDDTLENTDRCLKRLLNRMGPELALSLVDVQAADVWGQHPGKRDRLVFLDELRAHLQKLLDEQCCFTYKDMAVSGDDLLALGFSAGRRLGDVLHSLLECVMDGTCPNEHKALIEKAKTYL